MVDEERDSILEALASASERENAIARLHRLVRGGLAKSLSTRGEVDDADLDDFTQEAVERILDNLESFRGESRFTTWAMSIAIRTAFGHMRRREWKQVGLEQCGAEASAALVADDADPSADLDRDEMAKALRHAIDNSLTERQRIAILAELAGMPTSVLAEKLETNANAVYKLHHDARKKLRAALESAGFGLDDLRAFAHSRGESA